MGFRFKRIDLLAGSADFPVGDTDALRRTRSEAVVKAAAEALISMNIGWELDPNRNAIVTDYSNVPCKSGSKTFPGLFLRNTTSGCKLFLAYFGGSFSNSDTIKNFSNGSLFRYASSYESPVCGLVCSIIPGGSQSEFGLSFDSSFLPADATPIVGSCNGQSNASYHATHTYNPTSDWYYSWGLWATDSVIAVSASKAQSVKPLLPTAVYAVGKIFGQVFHNGETVNKLYGTAIFHYPIPSGDANEGWSQEIYDAENILGGTSIKLPGVGLTSGYAVNYVCGCVAKANGVWVNGTDLNTYIVKMFTQNPVLLASSVHSATGSTRWLPLMMIVQSSDLVTYGITGGDGLAGILDTSLFRATLGEIGTKFANDTFIQAEEPAYKSISFGWDPLNTDSILGS
jgi:hypothetical protein